VLISTGLEFIFDLDREGEQTRINERAKGGINGMSDWKFIGELIQ
jgi:hypothetical protein